MRQRSMLEKIRRLTGVASGVAGLIVIGLALWRYLDYSNNPGLYETYSAPWHTYLIADIMIPGGLTLIGVALYLYLGHRIKRKKEN